MQLPLHKTKIICTIGPASQSETVLSDMMRRGMTIARINFSHGTLEEHQQTIASIRMVAEKLGRRCPILVDLPGPKMRIGKLEKEPLFLTKGTEVTLTTRNVLGTPAIIPVTYRRLPESVSPGSVIYLNDGFIAMEVITVLDDEVLCTVTMGGQLLSGKGLNLPGAKIFMNPVTDRDLELMDFTLGEGITTFSTSFVETADDIIRAKMFAREKGREIYVVAKIERAAAVENIDEILEVADAIMIARGDLGVEIPIEEVPIVQKQLIRKANLSCRPIITATQMLESMIDNTRPTRAEATDVANAILDGTDAVMMSEETAIGQYPVEAVEVMARIAIALERQRHMIRSSIFLQEQLKEELVNRQITVPDTVSLNVSEAVRALGCPFVLTATSGGMTARRVSRLKPDSWIIACNNDERICDFLRFSYGVFPILMDTGIRKWYRKLINLLKNSGLIRRGDRVILTEGKFSGTTGGTDSLGIITIS
ncbi:MAG: pyruvate kinase [Deltaproteobacteria bacterium]|nr:pyruvate kinase [Deltaproteobacteria bacterium]